jgi:clan AA aspartic protease
MGKVVERLKLTSLFDASTSTEIDAVIDTGATMLVLPKSLVIKLGLRKIGEVTVKYADNRKRKKPIYAGLLLELKGRKGSFDVLAEENGTQPLVGQIVLEQLDLIVDPRKKRLVPNPQSPDMPMVEILRAPCQYPLALDPMLDSAGSCPVAVKAGEQPAEGTSREATGTKAEE